MTYKVLTIDNFLRENQLSNAVMKIASCVISIVDLHTCYTIKCNMFLVVQDFSKVYCLLGELAD